ncbi:MAG: glycerophosphodiester phosphodiesterase family protein [Nocardioides sp.]|jgi:glycerophosphoryl diester phosphodiesterase
MPRPQVVAHRGASHETAEHTLGAYVQALEAGADAIECDVRLTADGHLVCVHDRDLRRTAANKGVVSTMDLADLDQFDFASWKNPWGEDRELTDEHVDLRKVLTLRRLIETVLACDRRVEMAIETKHPTRYAGLVERKLAAMLREYDLAGPDSPVRVMSFSYNALGRMRRLTPDLRLVMLIERKRLWPMLKEVIHDDWILGPGVELLKHPSFAEKMVRSRRELHVWTVNTEADLRLCLDLGVKAVITDRPAFMLDRLGG